MKTTGKVVGLVSNLVTVEVDGRTKIENDKCKEYLSTLSTLTDENKERKLLPFYVKLPTKDKVLLKKYGKN